MTLQQREPFEDLAKSQKADKPKMVKPHKDSSSDTNNRCYVEKVKAVNEMVTQSSLNSNKCLQIYPFISEQFLVKFNSFVISVSYCNTTVLLHSSQCILRDNVKEILSG